VCPYANKASEEIGDNGRINPDTDEVENLEVLFFSTRLLRSELSEFPVAADLRFTKQSRVEENRQRPPVLGGALWRLTSMFGRIAPKSLFRWSIGI